MRKLQQLAVVAMAVGGLTALSAGVSLADTPAAPPQGQVQAPQGTEVAPQGQAQAPQSQAQAPQDQAQTQQNQMPAPQSAEAAPQSQPQAPQGTEIAPQVSPTVTLPQAPQLDSVLPSAPQAAPQEQYNIFRPYQECSPQTVLQANIPIAILGDSQTHGDTCTQVNNAFGD